MYEEDFVKRSQALETKYAPTLEVKEKGKKK